MHERHLAFDASHPAVPLAYVCGMLALTMFGLHPVLVAISLGCATLCSGVCRGWHATLRTLAWVAPAALLVTLFNPLISHSGATLLFRLGPVGVRLESLVFGACMGLMLASMTIWVACASELLPQDRVLAVLGGPLPTVALMISMTARLVPQLMGRAGEMRAATQATSAARTGTISDRVAAAARTSGSLVGWALTSSLDAADGMRARGWSSGVRRTTYQPHRFARRDAFALAAVAAGAIACAAFSFRLVSGFSFYPVLAGPDPWPGALLLVAYGLVPCALTYLERLSWEGEG